MADLFREEETVDDLLGGTLKIFQKKKGYRFSLDALLLSQFVKLKSGDQILDMGAGAGVIALILAKRGDCGKVTGMDIQEEMVEMATRSARLNKLDDRVVFLPGDVKEIAAVMKSQSFDAVVFNPPYRKLHSGRINPDDRKATARHEIRGSLGDFLAAARHVLKAGGRVFIIYPATRMVELLCRMRAERLEPKRVRLVHSDCISGGEFVLAEGVKGGGEELEVMAPLLIYGPDGEYTAAMKDIFRELSSNTS
ncbi:MAG: tRNA1(Val) (adenine(37)-N6)-methyltransferase [Deltaproteobacteria bacterium]|nr:tRNA1(Val) (adenine(37)-N6)-methyltransferase [Deltaproteobacteria bacterium]